MLKSGFQLLNPVYCIMFLDLFVYHVYGYIGQDGIYPLLNSPSEFFLFI
jgi:hypothetical protein